MLELEADLIRKVNGYCCHTKKIKSWAAVVTSKLKAVAAALVRRLTTQSSSLCNFFCKILTQSPVRFCGNISVYSNVTQLFKCSKNSKTTSR